LIRKRLKQLEQLKLFEQLELLAPGPNNEIKEDLAKSLRSYAKS